jgi:hypothetical protein
VAAVAAVVIVIHDGDDGDDGSTKWQTAEAEARMVVVITHDTFGVLAATMVIITEERGRRVTKCMCISLCIWGGGGG